MPDYTTETRTYIGEASTIARDGFAGFRTGQAYDLRYRPRPDGKIAIALDHEHYTGAGQEMVLSEQEFEKWFSK